MTDPENDPRKRQAANGEWYAARCSECNKRSRDPEKVGQEHDSIFCNGGVWEEY